MTKQEIREILASGGLSLLFTPKRQPTTEGGDASCPSTTDTTRTRPACSPAPSPTGGGAEDLEARGYDDGYRQGRIDETHAARRRALAGELARELEWCRDRFDAILARRVVRDVDEMRHAVDSTLARYHAAPHETPRWAMGGWSARVQASIDALTRSDQPNWQALAGDLADALLLAAHSQATEAVVVMGAKQALADYHEAITQHSGA
jgi:hypothetical protein